MFLLVNGHDSTMKKFNTSHIESNNHKMYLFYYIKVFYEIINGYLCTKKLYECK